MVKPRLLGRSLTVSDSVALTGVPAGPQVTWRVDRRKVGPPPEGGVQSGGCSNSPGVTRGWSKGCNNACKVQ